MKTHTIINANCMHEKKEFHHSQVVLTYLYGLMMSMKPGAVGLPVLQPRELIETSSVKPGNPPLSAVSVCPVQLLLVNH